MCFCFFAFFVFVFLFFLHFFLLYQDLVLRFLKRAAVNLQRNFCVVVPSKKLPLKERARILAQELAEFVQHYKKETLQLKKTLHSEIKDDISQLINTNDFNRFLQYSNESELEMILTTYAKLKKSASIFLGENTAPSLDDSQSSSTSTSMKEGKLSTHHKKDGACKGKKTTNPSKAAKLPMHRPASESSSRCLSAATQDISVDTYNEKAIQDALQSLVAKQQLRQYSAHRGTGILTSKTSGISNSNVLSLKTRSKSLERKSSNSFCVAGASSMSNLNSQEKLYIGLEKAVSDTLAIGAGRTHSDEICSNSVQCNSNSVRLCNSSDSLQINSASFSCKDLLDSLDFVESNRPSCSTSSEDIPNEHFCSSKIKQSNDTMNCDRTVFQHTKKTSIPAACSRNSLLHTSSIAGSEKRRGKNLKPPVNPLHKRCSSEPFMLTVTKNESIPLSVSAQRNQQQTPVHPQGQMQQKRHVKKTAVLHNFTLKKSTHLSSPGFDLTAKQQLYIPRPPVYRPRKPTTLYKTNSCVIPQPGAKSGDHKSRKAASYKTL